MSEEEKRINYLLDTIIESPSMQADELRKRIKKMFKTIEKQNKVIDKMTETFEAGLLYFKKCKNCENYTAVTYDTLKCRDCIKEYFYKEI